jgi:hypothetical protein
LLDRRLIHLSALKVKARQLSVQWELGIFL